MGTIEQALAAGKLCDEVGVVVNRTETAVKTSVSCVLKDKDQRHEGNGSDEV
jgi:hypothetical protein